MHGGRRIPERQIGVFQIDNGFGQQKSPYIVP
jgi:hypothetical protein